jgi:hypothetical protein
MYASYVKLIYMQNRIHRKTLLKQTFTEIPKHSYTCVPCICFLSCNLRGLCLCV